MEYFFKLQADMHGSPGCQESWVLGFGLWFVGSGLRILGRGFRVAGCGERIQELRAHGEMVLHWASGSRPVLTFLWGLFLLYYILPI